MNAVDPSSCLLIIYGTRQRMDPRVSHCAFVRLFFFLNIEHFGVQKNLCNYCTNNLRTVTQGHIKRNLYFISFI